MNIQLEDNMKSFENRVANIKSNPFQHKKVRQLWEKVFFTLLFYLISFYIYNLK